MRRSTTSSLQKVFCASVSLGISNLRPADVTTSWAGPMCCNVLADLGADVIKVEIPSGDVSRAVSPNLPGTQVSFMHATVNRNKRSLVPEAPPSPLRPRWP
ncbi:MAG: CoA transferase [Planctomycetes bacterium]|nr:CoA transferase [Planctomycetota bacterium]